MTIGEIKALEGDGSGAEEAPADAPVAETTVVEATEATETIDSKAAPLIHPAKLIDLEHDLPVALPMPVQHIKVKDGGHHDMKKTMKPAPSTASLSAPPTPDRQVVHVDPA